MAVPTAREFLGGVTYTGSQLQSHISPNVIFSTPIFNKPNRLTSLIIQFGEYLTREQYDYIMDLTYHDTGALVYDLNNYESVIEIIHLIKEEIINKLGQPPVADKPSGFAFVMMILNNVAATPDVDMVWLMPSMDEIRKKSEHEYRLMMEKPQGRDYKGNCQRKGCLSNNFVTFSAQMRSPDEPEDHFAVCTMCNTTFKI